VDDVKFADSASIKVTHQKEQSVMSTIALLANRMINIYWRSRRPSNLLLFFKIAAVAILDL